MSFKKILLTFFCLKTLLTVAQDPGTFPNYTPLGPNAAVLFREFEKPFGTFSGVLPVSIPLYESRSEGLELPVRLDYIGGGGIRAEEFASNVGLGWRLSVGGMITRIIKVLPDESGMLTSGYKPSGFGETQNKLLAVHQGVYDLEPDLYMINVNGITGKFVYTETGNIYVIEASEDFTIKNAGSYGTFVLTDERGYTYYLGANKSRTVFSTDFNFSSKTLGYQLQEVYDHNQQLLASFEYQSSSADIDVRRVAFITDNFGSPYTSGCTPADYLSAERFYSDRHTERILKKITTGTETIQFDFGNRIDGPDLRVNTIEIRDLNNNVKHRFNLNYDYFGLPYSSFITSLPEATYNRRCRRLKLKNISRRSVAGTDSITHSFVYEESVNLPDRYSTSVDYGGYYNGKYNTSTIPDGIYKHAGYAIGLTGYGDRRPDASYSIANTLKRIVYPSGGYREFTYESNQTLYITDAYYNGSLKPDANDHIYHSFDTSDFILTNPYAAIPRYTRNFTVNSTNGYAMFFFELDGYMCIDPFKVRISGSSPTQFIENQLSGNFLLPNGTYQLQFYFYPSDCSFNSINCYWEDLNLTNATIDRYGVLYHKAVQDIWGLRIKTIDDYDPVTANHKYTRFKYTLPWDTTLSSGLLVSYPRFMYRSNCPTKQCELMRIASQSSYPFNSEGTGNIAYTNVRVEEDGNNGYTDLLFSFALDEGDLFNEDYFPVVPFLDYGYKRGQLLSKRVYDAGKNLLQFDSTDYVISEMPPPVGGSSVGYRVVIHNLNSYCYNGYGNIAAGTAQPVKEVSVTYNGAQAIESKTEYSYYHSLFKRGVRQIKQTKSDGSTNETWFRYPYNANADFKLGLTTSERSMKDTLLNKNCLIPLEKLSWHKTSTDSAFIEGNKISYGVFNTFRKHPSVIKQFAALTDSIVFNFSKYDSLGHVLEQSRQNGINEVYLYGYKNNYVVAKVVGADYNSVIALVDNNILQNPSSDAALRAELNKIRTFYAGSSVIVSTYTHKDGVGLTSESDANGRVVFYSYDSYNRLINVRDHNNNILKSFSYSTAR